MSAELAIYGATGYRTPAELHGPQIALAAPAAVLRDLVADG